MRIWIYYLVGSGLVFIFICSNCWFVFGCMRIVVFLFYNSIIIRKFLYSVCFDWLKKCVLLEYRCMVDDFCRIWKIKFFEFFC